MSKTHAATKARSGARRPPPRKRRRRRSGPIYGGLAFIAIAAVVAVLVSVRSPGTDERRLETSPVKISAERLPGYTSGADPAVGMAAPEVQSVGFDGSPVSIRRDTNRPAAIVFLAHWCPHCQNEVPKIQAWLDSGGLPDGVDLISVVTMTDRTRPNYPPSEWLRAERWSPPVLLDDENSSVAQAYGLHGTPYWVFLDRSGAVAKRAEGEVSAEALERILGDLAAA